MRYWGQGEVRYYVILLANFKILFVMQNQIKTYFVKAVTNEGTTKPQNPQDAVEFVSVQLQEDGRGAKHRGSRTIPFITFFANNQADKETIADIKEAKNEDNTYDKGKLAEVKLDGVFMKKRVHPYYVLNEKGEVQKYREGHPDGGKPVIADTLPLFIFPDDLENIDAIVQRQMNGRKLVDLQSTDVSQYQNQLARNVLKKAKVDQEEDEQDAVEA
jgi:hypothetical protein